MPSSSGEKRCNEGADVALTSAGDIDIGGARTGLQLWPARNTCAGPVLQELLKARAEVEDAHEALKAEHRDVQARHSQASSEASSCTLQLADCRSRWAARCPATNGRFWVLCSRGCRTVRA